MTLEKRIVQMNMLAVNLNGVDQALAYLATAPLRSVHLSKSIAKLKDIRGRMHSKWASLVRGK